jgi:hypothetical protein
MPDICYTKEGIPYICGINRTVSSDNTNAHIKTIHGSFNTRPNDVSTYITPEQLNYKSAYKKELNRLRKKEIQDNINRSNKAQAKGISLEGFKNSAIGDKMRFFPDADDNSMGYFFDEYINPLKMIGDQADGLSQAFFNPSSTTEKILAVAGPAMYGAAGLRSSKNPAKFFKKPIKAIKNAAKSMTPILNPVSKFNLGFAAFNATPAGDLVNGAINTGMNKLIDLENKLKNQKQYGGMITNTQQEMLRRLKILQGGGPVKPTYSPDDDYDVYLQKLAEYENYINNKDEETLTPEMIREASMYGNKPTTFNVPQTPSQPPSQPVNTSNKRSNSSNQNNTYRGVSIVDYLNSIGVNSSKENRKKLAEEANIEDYNYEVDDNIALLNYLRGKQPSVKSPVKNTVSKNISNTSENDINATNDIKKAEKVILKPNTPSNNNPIKKINKSDNIRDILKPLLIISGGLATYLGQELIPVAKKKEIKKVLSKLRKGKFGDGVFNVDLDNVTAGLTSKDAAQITKSLNQTKAKSPSNAKEIREKNLALLKRMNNNFQLSKINQNLNRFDAEVAAEEAAVKAAQAQKAKLSRINQNLNRFDAEVAAEEAAVKAAEKAAQKAAQKAFTSKALAKGLRVKSFKF